MHRNTFVDAPRCMNEQQMLVASSHFAAPVFLAGQISGTEGYCEAIRSGLHAALNCVAYLRDLALPVLPVTTAYGSLLSYATNSATTHYQPKHVNFGDQPPLDPPIRNKRERYKALAARAKHDLDEYFNELKQLGLFDQAGNA